MVICGIVGLFDARKQFQNVRKVTAIYEQSSSSLVDSELVTILFDALKVVNSKIEYHSAFPSLSSTSNPDITIEQELNKLRIKNNRIFILTKFSLELAILIFKKANKMGMMEKGYVWIVSDEIASLLDSVDSSVISNMQGVISFRTNFVKTGKYFKRFKSSFRRKYKSIYPEEEENSNPSIFALRTYDATWAIARAMIKSEGNPTSKEVSRKILSSNFQGQSDKIRFKDNEMHQLPLFQIINILVTEIRFLLEPEQN